MQGVLVDPKQVGEDVRNVSPCFVTQKARAKHKQLEHSNMHGSMVNNIFMVHGEMEAERATLSTVRSSDGGAKRSRAIEEAAMGHSLRDAYASKAQRRGMVAFTGTEAAGYSDVELWKRGKGSVSSQVASASPPAPAPCSSFLPR